MRNLVRLCAAIIPALALCLALPSNTCLSSRAAPAPFSSTITVNSTSDGAANDGLCTLREAITSANADAASGAAAGECAAGSGADTISFSVTGTINLTGALPDINDNLTINGPGSSLLTVRRDTGGDYRIFNVVNEVTIRDLNLVVSISGLTVANGRTADADKDEFGYGVTADAGGGLKNGGTLTLTDVILTGNSTGAGGSIGGDGGGGAIFNTGTLTMTGCVVRGNSTGVGGASADFGSSGGRGGDGGGISGSFGPVLMMTDCVVSENTTGAGGDGTGNHGQGGQGGAGGGIFHGFGTMTLTRVSVSNNATSAGGKAPLGTPGLHGRVGGIFIGGISSGMMTDSIVSGNVGQTESGILIFSTLWMTNTTVSGNRLIGSGGSAVNNAGGLSTTFTNCTITANEGTGFTVSSSSASVGNTIIAGNGDNGPDVSGSFISRGHNLVGNVGGSTGFNTAGDQVGTSASPLNPRLGPLADNGGPMLTHALLAGSPALDGGSNALAVDRDNNPLTTDQRGAGFARIADAADAGTTQTVDIGAFEAHPSVEDVTAKATSTDTPLSFSFNVGDAALGIASVTASSGNTALFPNDPQHVSVTGSGSTRTLTLTPAANLTGLSTVTVNVTGTNGRSMTDTFQITVAVVNNAPVNAVPGAQTVVENGTLTFSAGNSNAVSVSDIDAGTDAIKVTLTATHGTLTLGAAGGLTFVTGDGSNDASMSFTGTAANVNLALANLAYKPDAGYSGAASVQIATDDQGHNGAGGALTDTDSVAVNVLEGGTLQLSAATYQTFEGVLGSSVRVTRTGGSAGAASVSYATSAGTATGGAACGAGVDYVNTSGTLNWNDGETADKFVNIVLCDDSSHESDETLNFTLSGAGGSGALGTPAAAVVTLQDDDPVGGLIQFTQSSYSVAEFAGSTIITVRRSSDTSQAVDVDYATDDGSVPSVAVPCSATTGLALDRCDYTKALGTLHFAAGEMQKTFQVLISDDSFDEGPEKTTLRLSNPTGGAVLGGQTTAALQITDDFDEASGNVIDDDTKFVRQHYHDFLNREPDGDGLNFWRSQITSCGADAQCREVRRINVSAAFFLSIEFQETGYFVHRIYKSAYGDATSLGVPGTVPVIRLDEFLPDTQRIGQNVVVGVTGWEQLLEANKQAYVLEFVQRPRFTTAFPSSLTAAQFVEQLEQNAGVTLTPLERVELRSILGATPADPSKRARVVRAVAENQQLRQNELNRAFVIAEYFGYLRRNPNDAPEAGLNYAGWRFWLSKLEEFNGNYIQAEMVKAFITSDEYRHRFGQ